MTKNKNKGQGRISAWLRLYGSNLTDLAKHLSVSLSRASSLCNSDTVPLHIREKLESFEVNGEKIPAEMLPEGKKRKPGPKKGWVERKIEQAQREAVAGL